MKRLILYETENHVEVLVSYLCAFSNLYQASFLVYAKRNILQELSTIFPEKSNIAYLDLSRYIVSDPSYDEVLLITSPVILSTLTIPLRIRVYLLVHNIHSIFFPFKHFNPKSFLSWIRYSALPFLRNRKEYQKLTGFVFIDQKLKNTYGNLIEKNYPNQKQIILPTFRPTAITSNKAKNVVIVVPGNIDVKRRDYHLLQKVLKNLSKIDLQFEFLGRKDFYWTEILKKSNLGKSQLKFYDEELTYRKYRYRLSKSDYVLFISREFKSYGGVKEKIGYSTYSAVLTDIWSLGKVAIIPGFIPIPTEFQNYILKYTSEQDLTNIIDKIKKNHSLNLDFRASAKTYYNQIMQTESKKIWI